LSIDVDGTAELEGEPEQLPVPEILSPRLLGTYCPLHSGEDGPRRIGSRYVGEAGEGFFISSV